MLGDWLHQVADRTISEVQLVGAGPCTPLAFIGAPNLLSSMQIDNLVHSLL